MHGIKSCDHVGLDGVILNVVVCFVVVVVIIGAQHFDNIIAPDEPAGSAPRDVKLGGCSSEVPIQSSPEILPRTPSCCAPLGRSQ